MTSTPLRVLIAENQYLIAMEVERMLREAVPCDVTITPLSQLSEIVATGAFDVVIVEAVLAEPQNAEHTHMITAAGARPVFLSSYDHLPLAGTAASGHPVVAKPPQSDELAAAVLKATHRRGPLDGKGLLDDR